MLVAVWLVMRHWKFVHEDGLGGVKFWDAQTPVMAGADVAGAGEGAAGADGDAVGAVGERTLPASSPWRRSNPHAVVSIAAAARAKKGNDTRAVITNLYEHAQFCARAFSKTRNSLGNSDQ